MSSLIRRVLRRLAVELGVLLKDADRRVAARTMPAFANRPEGLVIDLPREIDHPERMQLGRDVKIGPNSILKAKVRNPGSWLEHPEGDHVEQVFEPRLVIGDRVTATSAVQIVVFDAITIEDDVMIASNVFISDGTHGSRRGDRPYKYQGIDRIAPITIRRGAWLGQNVVISPGVTVGEYAVVGANSVVTSDVPDGCVAVGAPARIVRRWDGQEWHRVASDSRGAA